MVDIKKVRIGKDNWEVVYYLEQYDSGFIQRNSQYGPNTEIPEDKFQWVEKVFNEFNEVQNYLSEIYRETDKYI